MRYFVHSQGQRFGPAELPLLNQWAAEGRIDSNTHLEEEGTGRQFPASQMPGLAMLSQAPGRPVGGPFNPYGATGYQPFDIGEADLAYSLRMTWIGVIVSSLGICCPVGLIAFVFPMIALPAANRAIRKGHPRGKNARLFAIITLVSCLLEIAFYLALRDAVSSFLHG